MVAGRQRDRVPAHGRVRGEPGELPATSSPRCRASITQRYPKAGGVNPSVRLGIADVGSGATAWMDPEAAPYEYVVAVEWSPDNRRVAVQTENRLQTRLDLYFVDRASGKPTRVLTETDAGLGEHARPGVPRGRQGLPVVLGARRLHAPLPLRRGRDAREPGDEGPVVGAGPRRLHHGPAGGDRGGGRGAAASSTSPPSRSRRSSGTCTASASTARAWRGCRARTASHRVTFSPDRRLYLDVHSSHATLPSLSLRDADGALQSALAPPRADLLAGLDVQVPELLTVPADDGTPLQASLLKPRGFDPARRYPVILAVYGGPGRAHRARPVGRERVVQPAPPEGGLRRRQHRQPERHGGQPRARDLGRAPPVERRRAGRPPGRGPLAEGAALGRPRARRGLGLERRRHVHPRRPHAVEGVQGRHRGGPGHRLALLRHQVHRGLHEAARREPRGLRAHLPRVAGEGPPRAAPARLRNLRRQRASPEQLGLRGRGASRRGSPST